MIGLVLAAGAGRRLAPWTETVPKTLVPVDGDRTILDVSLANFARLGTPDSVAHHLGRAAEAGFTDVVVDVKPLSGEVLYASAVAPRLRTFGG